MHDIDMSNQRANMAYVGQKPWHGLGTDMPADADMEQWRIAAGLDWTACDTPAQFQTVGVDGNLVRHMVPDRKVLYRSDTKAPLSIVSNRYQPVQPKDVMDFYSALCKDFDFNMETAGSLKDGKVIWALAKTGEEARIHGNDVVNGYVLLSTSFDGTMATRVKHTSVRVVCNNTLDMAVRHGSKGLSVSHSTNFNPEAAREALGIGKGWDQFQHDIELLSDTPVSKEQTVEFFMNVYHDIVKDNRTLSDREEKTVGRTVERLVDRYLNSPGAHLPSARGTAWGLVNAVTNDVDFSERARSDDTRLASAFFGNGAALKNKAFEKALEIAA